MNYSELKSAVGAYIDHQDSNDRLELFIELARAKINRELMVRKMVCVATTRGLEGVKDYDLPLDWGGARQVVVDGCTVDYVTPQRFTDMVAGNYPSATLHYTIRGNKIRLAGAPGVPDDDDPDNIELTYYQKLPKLVDDTDTNWLLTNHPDCWLYFAISEGHAYVLDEERAQFWEQRGAGVLQRIEAHDWNERWSGGPMRIRAS